MVIDLEASQREISKSSFGGDFLGFGARNGSLGSSEFISFQGNPFGDPLNDALVPYRDVRTFHVRRRSDRPG
jgi:hypothetical protein